MEELYVHDKRRLKYLPFYFQNPRKKRIFAFSITCGHPRGGRRQPETDLSSPGHHLDFAARLTCFVLVALLFSACTPSHDDEVDKLNASAYAQRYRDLGKTQAYARKALSLARQRN